MKNIFGLSRRQMLSVLSLFTISGTIKGFAFNKPTKKATFVLVHGAWHGGWCWKKVIPLLRVAGHEVFTPTLTGLGERVHLLNEQIDLNTHIQDIIGVLEYEDLKEVILVGHSYAGMVIAGVAEKAASRISQLVYLDAFLPENGKALKDYVPNLPWEEMAQKSWHGSMPGTLKDFGITDKEDINWMTSRIGEQPIKASLQPLALTDQDKSIKKTFIQLSESPWFSEAAERAQRNGFGFYKLLSGGHDAMVTKPKELVDIFSALV